MFSKAVSHLHQWVSALGLALLVTGCGNGNGPLRPIGPAVLAMEWSAERRSTPDGDVVDLTARVTNRGRTAVTYFQGCGATPWRLDLFDPARRNVNDICACPDPCAICLSPPSQYRLEPGESVTSSRTFSGELRDCAGIFAGSAGTYVAVAEFRASAQDGSRVAVFRSLDFQWSAPGP